MQVDDRYDEKGWEEGEPIRLENPHRILVHVDQSLPDL